MGPDQLQTFTYKCVFWWPMYCHLLLSICAVTCSVECKAGRRIAAGKYWSIVSDGHLMIFCVCLLAACQRFSLLASMPCLWLPAWQTLLCEALQRYPCTSCAWMAALTRPPRARCKPSWSYADLLHWLMCDMLCISMQTMWCRMCYLFCRCTRSVSVAPPAYYAHLAAFRGRAMLYYSDTSESESAKSGRSGPPGATSVQNATINPKLARTMYYV